MEGVREARKSIVEDEDWAKGGWREKERKMEARAIRWGGWRREREVRRVSFIMNLGGPITERSVSRFDGRE